MNTPTYNEILTELRRLALCPSGGELPPVVVNEQDSSPMVLVPAGSFTMGDDLDKESPQRTVILDAFYISVYAVTNRQYRAFVQATGHRPPNIGARIDSLSVWHEETDSANTASGEESLRQERGGCWRYPDKFAFRCSQRSFVVSKAVNDFRGFRMVLPVRADS
ncbi:MAG: SUMF1/EgtB/PvdO family nonheme iron enzyme [Chlorobium sp.]|jgi:hypothetical protein|nr:SUMF1/EgtB/PvdO family nonheme iron enzyme [Chlorobium sp.]